MEKKLDYKVIGGSAIGGGSLIGILFTLMSNFQTSGIDQITASQEAQNKLIIQLIKTNSKKNDEQDARLDKQELTYKTLNKDMVEGFKETKQAFHSEIKSLTTLLIATTQDRYTKSEHLNYAESAKQEIRSKFDTLEFRLQRIENDIRERNKK